MEKLYWFTIGFTNLVYLGLCLTQVIMDFEYTVIITVLFILIIDFFIFTAYYFGRKSKKEIKIDKQ